MILYKKIITNTKSILLIGLNKYENVIIFPSKGKRPHPDECSGSDLDGDNYFVFYDSDLIPKKTVEPMTYAIKKNEKGEEQKILK